MSRGFLDIDGIFQNQTEGVLSRVIVRQGLPLTCRFPRWQGVLVDPFKQSPPFKSPTLVLIEGK